MNKRIVFNWLMLLGFLFFAIDGFSQKPSARDARKQAYTRAMEARKTKNELDPNLFEAIKNNDLPMVDSLLDAGVNLHATDKDGANALMWACYYGDSTMVASLYDRGAVGPKLGGGIYYEGETTLGTPIKGWYGSPLAVAAGEGKVGVLNYLLDVQKVDVNEQSVHLTKDSLSGWTALMHGGYREKVNSIYLLLNNRSIDNSLFEKELIENIKIKELLTNNSKPRLDSLLTYYELENKFIKAKEKEDLEGCIDLGESLIKLSEKMFGLSHQIVSDRQYELGQCYEQKGDLNNAISMYEASVESLKKEKGEKNIIYIRRIRDLGENFKEIGGYQKAFKLLIKAKELAIETSGTESNLYSSCMNGLGNYYDEIGAFEEAFKCYTESLEIDRSTFGYMSEEYAIALANISMVNMELGFLSLAINQTEEVFNIYEEINLEKDLNFYIGKNNLGALYLKAGNYGKALSLSLESSEGVKSLLGDKHFYYGAVLNSIAVIYKNLLDYDKAIELYEKSLVIFKSSIGVNHRYYSIVINNIAVLHMKKGDNMKAIELLDQSLEIVGGTLGINNSDYGVRLSNLGKMYCKTNEKDKGLSLLEKGVCVARDSMKKSDMNSNICLKNLADFYLDEKRFVDSEKLLVESNENIKKHFGSDHFEYGVGLKELAFIYERLNKTESLVKAYDSLIDYSMGNIRNKFSTIPFKLKTTWKKEFEQNQQIANSFSVRRSEFSKKALFNFNLAMKKLILFSVKKQSFGNENSLTYDRYNLLERQIGQQLSIPESNRFLSLDSLQYEAEKLETFLLANNKNFKNQNQEVTVKKLKQKLNPKEAIIDIVHFDYYDIDRKTDTILYVAYLLANDRDSIQSIKLFEEKELQTILSSSTNSDNMLAQLYTRSSDPKFPSKKTEGLSMIWKPLLPHLKDYETIYLSPSGLLNKINLGAITVSENKLASDQFKLVQYNSFRSMLEEFDERPNNDFLLVGGVNYEAQVEEIKPDTNDLFVATSTAEYTDETIREMRSRVTCGENWNELPGTKLEVQQIEKLLDQKKYNYTSLMDTSATEEQVKQLLSQETSPRVVHFSTHGFFYPDPDSDDKNGSAFRISDDPMIRSGLILAGADYAWERGEVPPGREDDGILTAYEVANLNLTDTDLVVLSACETGLGDIQGSEGVFGLQRAFKIAGARYIIMSLWSVEDEATQKMMVLFYRNWLDKGMEIPDAFRMAQKEMRQQFPESPNKWAGFILVE